MRLGISKKGTPEKIQDAHAKEHIQRLYQMLSKIFSKKVNDILLSETVAQLHSFQEGNNSVFSPGTMEYFGIPASHQNNPTFRRDALRWFVANYSKPNINEEAIRYILKHPQNFKKSTENTLLYAGLATELFLLYALRENQELQTINNFRHFKAPPLFDEREKIDIVTQMFSDQHDIRHNVGVQITTTHFESSSVNKKREIFAKIYRNPKNTTSRFVPQSGCFLIINGAIGRVNTKNHGEQGKETPYSKAMTHWAKQGYGSEGPLQYLSENLANNYQMVAEVYMDALEAYRRFIFNRDALGSAKMIDFSTGSVYRKITYAPKEKIYTFCYLKIEKISDTIAYSSKKNDFIASFSFYLPERK